MTEPAGPLEPVFDLLDRMVAEEEVPGAAIAVAHGGKPLAEYAVGIASPEQPATAETLWPLASISKLYTAAAVMALVERGLLAPSTPVSQFVPAGTGEGREQITVRHLLTHTSGLIYESPEMEARLKAQTPLDAITDEVFDHPLLFPPGTKQSYSDLGYALLGRVAATVGGKPFPELLRDLVLDPAGLFDTFMPPSEYAYHRLAYIVGAFAEGTDGAMYNSPYALNLAHPAFGVVATVGDLLRFGLRFVPFGPPLLAGATVRAMTSNQTLARGWTEPDNVDRRSVEPWGFGFMIRSRAGTPALASPGSFGHDGASGCVLWIDPAQDVVVAFVSNLHLRADREGLVPRLERAVNTAIACLTR